MGKEMLQEKDRHWGLIYVSPEYLLQFLKPLQYGRAFSCIEGLPHDARLVYAGYDSGITERTTGRFYLVVEHDSFPCTKSNEKIPELNPPKFELLYDDKEVKEGGIR